MSGLYCAAASTRGQLKHSWLENQILNKAATQIVALQKLGWPALVDEFPGRLRQAHFLADEVEGGFSPAQLIDRLQPLRQLPESERRAIRVALHAAYLELIDTDMLSKKLTAGATALALALAQLSTEWDASGAASDAKLAELWGHVLVKAAELVAALDELPHRIVLP